MTVTHAAPQQTTPATSANAQTPATAQPANADAERQALVLRALGLVPAEWKLICGSLMSEADPPVSPPGMDDFKEKAYERLAKRDGSGRVGADAVKAVLASSPGRQAYLREWEKVDANVREDGTRRQAIINCLEDLRNGGDLAYNTDRIVANFMTTTTPGRKWWKGEEATPIIAPAAAYAMDFGLLYQHTIHIGGPTAAMHYMKVRGDGIRPLLNLLKLGQLTLPEVKDPKAATAKPDEKKPEDPTLPTAPTDADKKKWDEEAAKLKAEMEPFLPKEPGAEKKKEPHGTDAVTRNAMILKLTASPIEVRDRINADVAFMRRFAMLGDVRNKSNTGEEFQTLGRALDPIAALYDEAYGYETTATEGRHFKEISDKNPAPTPQSRFIKIRNYMLQHPGKEGQPIRLRVMTYPQMLSQVNEEDTRTLWRLATRGTLEPSFEDKLYLALKTDKAATIARCLLGMTGEDRDSFKAMQDDIILRRAMATETMRESVVVDGITVRPLDLVLLAWGQRPGASDDPGQTGINEGAKDEARPLDFKERQTLDHEVYNPTINKLKSDLSAADSWFMSGARTDDDDVVNHLNEFQNTCADPKYVELIRRSGQPPGRELTTRYNALTGKSIHNLIKEGCGDKARRTAERVLNISLDSASVGTVGGKVQRAGDKDDAAPMDLAQALRETKTGENESGETISIVVHAAAADLRRELYEGLAWNGADLEDVLSIWDKLDQAVKPALAKVKTLTKKTVWTIELLQNAYLEIDGPLTKALDKRLGDSDRKTVKAKMGLTDQGVADRAAQAKADAPQAKEDKNAAAVHASEQIYGTPAKELFEAMTRLSRSSDKGAFEAVRVRLGAYLQLRSAAALAPPASGAPQRISQEQAPDVAPNSGVVVGTSPEDWYRNQFGITPNNHAVQIARSFRTIDTQKDKDYTAPEEQGQFKPDDVAGMLGVDKALVGGAVQAPPDSEKPVIDDHNLKLVRPGFTVQQAENNAADMWRILHGGGEVHLIQTSLYGVYNDEEQRLIRLAFRRLSGGIDWQFYTQQAKLQQENKGKGDVGSATSVGDKNTLVVGGEGTEAGQKLVGGKTVVNVTGDAGELNALNAVAAQGEMNIRDRLRNAISHEYINQVFRICDEADDGECRAILADTELMALLEDKLSHDQWDRVHRVLTGSDDLAVRLESRSHGEVDSWWESHFGGTDEAGMKEDVKAYVARLKGKFEAEEVKKARSEGQLPDAELITLIVTRRVREACRKLAANPEINKIIEEELNKSDGAATMDLILNGGVESNSAAMAGGGSGEEMLDEIKRMNKAERDRRLADPEYMKRLSSQLKKSDMEMALVLLQSPAPEAPSVAGGDATGGGEKLPEGDKLAEVTKLAADGHANADDILQLLTKLTASEHERLINDPPLIAKLMSSFQHVDKEKRQLIENILNFRKEGAEQTLGKGVVYPDAKGETCEGRSLPDKEQQRLAYLQENAVNRIVAGAQISWNYVLAALVEVFKMDFVPRYTEATPAPATATDPAEKKPATPFVNPAAAEMTSGERLMREAILKRVQGDAGVKDRADDDTKMKIVSDAVMHVMDPSADRVRNAWGRLRDDSSSITDTLQNVSDEKLIESWASVKTNKPNGDPPLLKVYEEYKASYDAAGGEKPVDSAEQEALRSAKLAYMNYVVDVSTTFETDLLAHAGGIGDDNTPTKEGEAPSRVKQRDNEEYNKWRKIVRDRIPQLPKLKIAAALNITRKEDVDLLVNPNRSFQTGREFRQDEHLRKFGTEGAGSRVADKERAAVNDTMSRYGREGAKAETNEEGGYGIITEGEGAKVEKLGADHDRAMQEFTAARAKVASLAGLVVGMVVGAIVTIITGGAGAGIAWMLVAGAISGAAGAAAQAATQKAIQGSEYDMNQEGLQTIAEGAITGLISAGTTKMAQGIMGKLKGLGSLGAQAEALEGLAKVKPTVWQQLLGAGQAGAEGMLQEGLTIVAEAGLAPLDPSLWLQGWDEGTLRARHKIREKVDGADKRLLNAGIISALTHVAGGKFGKKPGEHAPPPMRPDQKEQVAGKLEKHWERISKNAARYADIREISIQAFSSFIGQKISAGLFGDKPVDWSNIPEEMFTEFVNAFSGLQGDVHAGYARLGKRRQMELQQQLDQHGGLLMGAEREHYISLNPQEGVGQIITIAEYLSARQGMLEARMAMWEGAIKRRLTPNEKAAYELYVRSAKDSAEYQQRLAQNPLDVEAVKKAGEKFSTDKKNTSGTEDFGPDTKPKTSADGAGGGGSGGDKKPPGPNDNGGGGDKKPDKDPKKQPSVEDMSKITGNVEAIKDSTFDGQEREQSERGKVEAEIVRSLPLVASHFGEGAQVAGPNTLLVKSGDVTIRITVTVMPAESSDLARFRFTGPESGSIEVSDRVRDKHVERSVADMVAEMRALREAQQNGKTLPAESALKPGSTSKELSAKDLGAIAQLKVLLRQLAQAENPSNGEPNPVVIKQLGKDIDVLMASLGLEGGGSEARIQDLVGPHLTQAEMNRLTIRKDAPRREDTNAKLGPHAGTELHNHFLGVVKPEAFADSVLAAEQAKLDAKNEREGKPKVKITKSSWEVMLTQIAAMDQYAHKRTEKDGDVPAKRGEQFNKRGVSGDAVALAKLAETILNTNGMTALDGAPEWMAAGARDLASLDSQLRAAKDTGNDAEMARLTEAINAKKAQIAKQACDTALTATDDTDFNSAYEVRDELIKNNMGGPEAEAKRREVEKLLAEGVKPDDPRIKKLQDGAANAAYADFAHQTVAELIKDGLLYNEQSNSLNKLNKRFGKAVMDKAIWDVTAEMIKAGKITEGQALQLRQLTMVNTGFFGDEETRANEDATNPDAKARREKELSPQKWDEAKSGLRDQLGIDDKGNLKEGKDGFEGRSDVMGIDIAGPETATFNETGGKRLEELYGLLKQAAKARNRPMVLRPHVGEGFTDMAANEAFHKNKGERKGDEASHYERSRKNLDLVLATIQHLQDSGQLDPNLVIIRFGHATHATPEQAQKMAQLGIIAELNLHSNIKTGSLDQLDPKTGESYAKENYDDHSLLTMLYFGTKSILSTDAHSVMDTNMTEEYERAGRIIDEFLGGKAAVRVPEKIANGRGKKEVVNAGTPMERTDFLLSRDDMTSGELGKFLTAKEQLHKWATEYRNDVAKADRKDKLLWQDLFNLMKDKEGIANDEGKRLHLRDLMRRLVLTPEGKVDDGALAFGATIDKNAVEELRKQASDQANSKFETSLRQKDATDALNKDGNPDKAQRATLEGDIRKQVPDIALVEAVKAGDANTVMSVVTPGGGDTGIKTMNDKLIGYGLNSAKLIPRRNEIIRRAFEESGDFKVIDQGYKTTTVVSKLEPNVANEKLPKILDAIDKAMKPLLLEVLNQGIEENNAKLADPGLKQSDRENLTERNEAMKKAISSVESGDFRFDFNVGSAKLTGGKDAPYKEILAAEMNATKAAITSRGGTGDKRAGVYTEQSFLQFCQETVKIKEELVGAVLPFNVPNGKSPGPGELIAVIDSEGHINRDLLRAVRKDKYHEKLDDKQKAILGKVEDYFRRVNAFDYMKHFTGDEADAQALKIAEAQKLIDQLHKDGPVSKEAAADINRLLSQGTPQQDAATEAQFFNRAAGLTQRTVLNADIKDLGLDLFKGYEDAMSSVGGKNTPKDKASLDKTSQNASDGVIQFKRNASDQFKDFYRETLLPKAKALAEAMSKKSGAEGEHGAALLKALANEGEPIMLLGGDEITVSLHQAFEELHLVNDAIKVLTSSKIANARVAVTHTGGDVNGADGHKAAMKRSESGHDKLKKELEPLAQKLRQKQSNSHEAEALASSIDRMYLVDENGEFVVYDENGNKVDLVMVTARAKKLLGE